MGTFIDKLERADTLFVKTTSTGSGEAMASVTGGQGGLGDILSLALKKTGVSSTQSQLQLSHGEPSSVLNQAAGAINDSLLSSDISTLTQGLFTDLASVKSSPNSLNSTPSFTERVPHAASPTVNGTGLVNVSPGLNSTTSSSVSEPLSMPILVKPEPTSVDQCQQSPFYPQNSILSQRPSSTLAVTSASLPVSFSGVSGNGQATASSFGGQGGAPALTTNSNRLPTPQDQTDPSHYDYSKVLQGDDIDLEGLDEFLAADPDPMDIPPPPPLTPFQNHQQPSTYSSQQAASMNTMNTGQGLLYSQPSGVHSGSPDMPPFPTGHSQQQQVYHRQQQYGVQQSLMSPAYGGPGNLMSPQRAPLQPSQPTVQAQPFSQQAVSGVSFNNGHFASALQPSTPMSTDLSDILPSTSSLLPSAPQTNGELVSLSDADIHNILDLDDLDLDINQFDLESSMSSDPLFPSFGMSSVDLIQPSNTVRLNGSALVNNSMGSAVNSPPMRFGVQQQPASRPGFPNSIQHSRMGRFNIHSPVFGRSGQTPRTTIPRVKFAPSSRGSSAVPMPPQGVVSESLFRGSRLSLCASSGLVAN